MKQDLEKSEKSEEEKFYDFAFETREFIEELYNRFFDLGLFKKENDSLRRSLDRYAILIDHLTEFGLDPENEYLGSVYDDYSANMQLLFKGLREEGLTLKNNLENYNENIHEIARKFGEVNERLRKLQEMATKFEKKSSNDNQNNSVETTKERNQVRELQATILKFKWAMIFVCGLTFLSSITYLSYASKGQKKLRSENAELKDEINRVKKDAEHYKKLFEMCTKVDNKIDRLFDKLPKSTATKNSTEIKGPRFKPQD